MKTRQIADGIYHVICESAKELGMSFLRPQEHYENAFFRGKVFSLEDFRQWWIKKSKPGREAGRFNYCTYWEGFNIPSSSLIPFYKGDFNPLSDYEKRLLDKFEGKERFYAIGTREGEKPETLKHELGHSLYGISRSYRKTADEVVASVPAGHIKKLEKFLAENCYHQAVWQDEKQAYLLAGDEDDLKDAGLSLAQVKDQYKALNKIYERILGRRMKK